MDKTFNYMLLGRLQMDIVAKAQRLWGITPERHIEKMKELWNSFADNEKPQWISWEDILYYEKILTLKER